MPIEMVIYYISMSYRVTAIKWKSYFNGVIQKVLMIKSIGKWKNWIVIISATPTDIIQRNI